MPDNDLFLIDIEQILKEKMPRYYNYIPKFLIRYLKKISHQEELNPFLIEAKDKVGVEFLEAAL